MRTTLTIDESLGHRLKSAMRKSGKSLKVTVNELLLLGLEAAEAPKPKKRKFQIKARDLGVVPGIDYTKTSDMLDWVDGT